MQRRKLVFRTVLVGFLYVLALRAQVGPTQTAVEGLSITGDIPAPLVLRAEDLAKMTRESVSILEHDGSKGEYEGVPLREILKRAGAPVEKELRGKALTSYVVAKGSDGYEVVIALAEVAPEFANESMVVADKRGGKPLPEHFGPLRLICPNDKAAARSVRMIESLEVVRLKKVKVARVTHSERTMTNNLGTLREQRGISVARLAAMVGVARQSVYAMEAGSFVPNTEVALKLARVLECHVEDLFCLNEDPPPPAIRTETASLLPGSEDVLPGQSVQLSRVGEQLVATPSGAHVVVLSA